MRNKILISMLIVIMAEGCFENKKDVEIKKSEKVMIEATEMLFVAIKKGSISLAKTAIKRGADVNNHGYYREEAALIEASRAGHIEIVKELLKAGADVNAKDRYGSTALINVSRLLYTDITSRYCVNALEVRYDLMSELADQLGGEIEDKDLDTVIDIAIRLKKTGIEIVKELLRAGADVNTKDKYGRTALMVASRNGHAEVVRELLRAGTDVNEKDIRGRTALIRASRKGHIEIVREQLRAGADVNEKDIHGRTALMRASNAGKNINIGEHIEVVRELLKAGADANAKDNYGKTALIWAKETDFIEAANLLTILELKEGKKTDDITKLIEASVTGQLESVKTLIKEGVLVNTKYEDGSVALHWASKGGHAEIVKELLKAGAEVNAKDNHEGTALMLATGEGYIEVVKELLRAGANVNAEAGYEAEQRETALMRAIKRGHIEIVKELLRAGADVNTRESYSKKTALMVASSRGYIEIVRELLKAGADANHACRAPGASEPLLISAIKGGQIEIARELLKAGVDVNAQHGIALIIASDRGYIEVVKELLRAGANVNAEAGYEAEQRETALMRAIKRGHIEIVKELLRAGADVNTRESYSKKTALMVASSRGYIEIVRELLKAGADINLKSIFLPPSGYFATTALMCASEEGHIEIVRELLRAGANVNEGTYIRGYTDVAIIYELIGAGADFDLDMLSNILEEAEIIYAGTKHELVPIEILRKYCNYISERESIKKEIGIDNIIQKYLIKEKLGELVYDIVNSMSETGEKIYIDIKLLRILHDYISYLNRQNAIMLVGQKVKNAEESPISIIDPLTIRNILSLTKINGKDVIEGLTRLKEEWAKKKRDIAELRVMKEELLINELFAEKRGM